MIKWRKLDAGEYESEDKRFYIIKTYDTFYGNHWQLSDSKEKDYYKSMYHEQTLADCKAKAEAIVKFEKTTFKEGLDNAIAGKSFCITGSLENFVNCDACAEFIEQNGGRFVSGVSKKTDYLVNNDIASKSGKNKKAKELGVPIITEKQLIEASEGIPLPDKGKPKGMER